MNPELVGFLHVTIIPFCIRDPILSSTSAFKIRRDAMMSALSTSITSGTTPSAAFLNHMPRDSDRPFLSNFFSTSKVVMMNVNQS